MRLGILFCCVAFLFAGVAKSEIVAHWPADGSYDDVVDDHDGMPIGTTSFVDGVFGQAFFFDGQGGHVLVPDAPEFDFGTGDFTVTFRVSFVRIVANGSGIIDKDNFSEPSLDEYNGWLFNNASQVGGIGFETRNVPEAGPYYNRISSSNFDLLTWYNITATRQDAVTYLYVDGELVGTETETIPADVDNDISLIIGGLAPSGPGDQPLHGSVDDIAIYNHALSASDVQKIFLHGVAGADFLLGDVNCDGEINLLDVTPFVDAVSSGDYDAKADTNLDGNVNLLDVGPFVALLTGG